MQSSFLWDTGSHRDSGGRGGRGQTPYGSGGSLRRDGSGNHDALRQWLLQPDGDGCYQPAVLYRGILWTECPCGRQPLAGPQCPDSGPEIHGSSGCPPGFFPARDHHERSDPRGRQTAQYGAGLCQDPDGIPFSFYEKPGRTGPDR